MLLWSGLVPILADFYLFIYFLSSCVCSHYTTVFFFFIFISADVSLPLHYFCFFSDTKPLVTLRWGHVA